MKMGFHMYQLGLRGGEVSVFDYAYHAREMLGIHPIIYAPSGGGGQGIENPLGAVEKFQKEFEVVLYGGFMDVIDHSRKSSVDVMYYQHHGKNDSLRVEGIKNVVHVMFQNKDPYNDVYAYVSKWLADTMEWPLYVPYMVDIQRHYHTNDMRDELQIPKGSMVFGFHGGPKNFDIDWVKSTVLRVAKEQPDRYFVFMNIEPFTQEKLRNVIFLPGAYDMVNKVKFINTCDAMLYARTQGEGFGCSIAEFSSLNKPILLSKSIPGGYFDRGHFELLGDKAIYFDESTVYDIVSTLKHSDINSTDWNAYQDYTPEKIMAKFNQVFLS